MNLRKLIPFLLCSMVPVAFAAISASWQVDLRRGSTILKTYTAASQAQAWDACMQAIPQTVTTAQTYTCKDVRYVANITPPPPQPVDCVVSPWSEWVPGPWGTCTNGTQMRTETRTRSIITPPANGGAACPPLTETRTVTQPCSTNDADAIWNAIRTSDGVSAAYGFDSQEEFNRGYQPGANGVRGFWDTAMKHSGAGAIRLEARAGETSANISGQWGLPSNTLGKGYGAGSEMWLTFMYRADAGFIEARKDWNSNPKVISIYSGSVPCQPLELTLVWPLVGTTLYTACGNNLSTATTSAKGQNNTPPYLYQHRWDLVAGGSAKDPNGVESAYPDAPAFQFKANSWYRILLHVKRTSPNWVEMWAQAEGGPWVKFVAWTGTLQSSGNGSLDNAVLMNYMTGLSSRSDYTGNVWYDEFAISSKPFPIH